MLTLYKASAGSGKTYNLAKEYLRHLLAYKTSDGVYHLRYDPDKGETNGRAHQHILAITFTVAATNEMKKRIIEALDALSRCETEDCDYRDDFLSEFATTPSLLARASRVALRELLFGFNEFNVSTIDSFFQMVLRTFAREIDLPGNYEVELDEKRVVALAVNEIIARLNRPNEAPTAEERVSTERLANWLIDYMEQSIEGGSGFNVFNRNSSLHASLVATLNSIMDEKFMLNRAEITEYLSDGSRLEGFNKALHKLHNDSKERFREASRAALRAIEFENAEELKMVSSNMVKAFKKFAAEGMPDKLGTTIPGILANPEKKFLKKFQSLVGTTFDRELQLACESVVKCFNDARLSRALKKSLYSFGILSYVLEQMERYRQDEDKVLISDTNDKIGRIIGNDNTPFVYERIGFFLQHFLLDEFQDTSEMQWHNLKPLLLESLSSSHDNLIIGDEKQCIYRFRNSDPELLGRKVVEELHSQRMDDIAERGVEPKENTNWRSAADIIRFNNSFFTSFARVTDIHDTYSNVIQGISPKHSGTNGYVDMIGVEIDKRTQNELFKEIVLQRMGDEIARQISAGYSPRDIAVIVRRNGEGTNVINYLLDRMKNEPDYPKMEITSSESINIGSSSAVKLILSVLRFIDSPESIEGEKPHRSRDLRDLSRLVNQFEFNFNLSDKVIADGEDAIDCTKSLVDALDTLDGEERYNTLVDKLTESVTDMECVSLPSVVERIIERYFSESERDKYNIFLSAFQDQVIDFCSQGLSDIHSFLEWWAQSGCYRKIEIPSTIDALTVITIHKAKGLQYKCVHVPFVSWELTMYSSAFKENYEWFRLDGLSGIDKSVLPRWIPLKLESVYSEVEPFRSQIRDIFKQQMVDNTNLLYVAFTRAERELTVTYPIGETASVKSLMGDEDAIKAESISGYVDLAVDYWSQNKVSELGDNQHLLTSLRDKCQWVNIETNDEDNPILHGKRLIIGSPTVPLVSSSKRVEEFYEVNAAPPYCTYSRDDVWALAQVDDFVDIDSARQQGTFLHAVLSRVRHVSDLELAFKRQAYRVMLADEERDSYLAMLRKALGDERVGRWFDGYVRVLNERTIMPGDDSEQNYRPDRVVWTFDGAIEVIDYKFGEHHGKYVKQVKCYMNLLSEIYPTATVRGFLWYPLTSTIIPVE